jgi:hypothetical protein
LLQDLDLPLWVVHCSGMGLLFCRYHISKRVVLYPFLESLLYMHGMCAEILRILSQLLRGTCVWILWSTLQQNKDNQGLNLERLQQWKTIRNCLFKNAIGLDNFWLWQQE